MPVAGLYRGRCARLVLGIGLAAGVAPAQALKFQLFDGAVDGSFDTTLTYGLSLRTEGPNPKLTNPGKNTPGSVNFGNQYGNRSLYADRWDIISNTVKASHDLQLKGDRWGAFMRGNYFYDFEAASQPLPEAAENRAVRHGDITDAYVYKRLGSADQLTVRLGKQVISWGENTFIGGALNDINTVDITKLRQPGVELKDALVGTPALDVTWSITEALSVEAFTLFAYDEVKPDVAGSFFGTLDPISDGGGYANGTVLYQPPGPPGLLVGDACYMPDGGRCDFTFNGVPVTRAPDDLASSGGQFGVALRYYANILNGIEFGAYYQRLHDHNPQISAIAGTAANPGKFFLEYAEDVDRYGLSFNTIVGPWAWGGEYSYRPNAPIQGLNFANVAAFGVERFSPGGPPVPVGPIAAGTRYQGFERYDRHQIQTTVQRLWGPMPMFFGADQWNTIAEFAYGWVDHVPGVDNNGHHPATAAPNLKAKGDNFLRFDDITNDFWGFVARSTLTYNNALFNSVNMDFNTSLRWDVEGVSPEVGGAQLFVGGRKQVSVGVVFEYAQRWRLGLTQAFAFGGEEQFRPLSGRNVSNSDRDFFSVDVSYTF